MIRRAFGLALLVCAMVVLPQLQISVPKMSLHGKMTLVSAQGNEDADHNNDKDKNGPNGDDK